MEKGWADTPADVLCTIMSLLESEDERRIFNSVCRSWRAITLPPLPYCPYFSYSVNMVFSLRNTPLVKIYNPLYNQFYHTQLSPSFNADVWSSNFEWLLMLRPHDLSLFFLNPFTKQTIEVPASKSSFFSLTFSSEPTSRDCFILGVLSTSSSQYFRYAEIYHGQTKWTYHSFENRPWFQVSHCCYEYIDDTYYFLGVNGDIGLLYPISEDEEEDGDDDGDDDEDNQDL